MTRKDRPACNVSVVATLDQLAEYVGSISELIDELLDTWFRRAGDGHQALVLAMESRLQAMRDPDAAELLGAYYRHLHEAIDRVLVRASERFGAPG